MLIRACRRQMTLGEVAAAGSAVKWISRSVFMPSRGGCQPLMRAVDRNGDKLSTDTREPQPNARPEVPMAPSGCLRAPRRW